MSDSMKGATVQLVAPQVASEYPLALQAQDLQICGGQVLHGVIYKLKQ